MDKLIKAGFSKKDALLVAQIRQCYNQHGFTTVDDTIEEQICCSCGRSNMDRGSGKYDCHLCKEPLCGNCCESLYYGRFENTECHNKYRYDYCEKCGIAYRHTEYCQNFSDIK